VAALTAAAAAVQPNAAAAQMRWINLVIPSLLTLWMVWKLSAGSSARAVLKAIAIGVIYPTVARENRRVADVCPALQRNPGGHP
jgi:hypothetical protein